jgi:hypothetical protein
MGLFGILSNIRGGGGGGDCSVLNFRGNIAT